MTRNKEYSRLILYCHFCQTVQKSKNDLLLIHLEEQDDPADGGYAVVKICLRCREIIDPMHQMVIEEMK